MLQTGHNLLKLEKHEKISILSYCARTAVGFLSESDQSFYGSGVLLSLDGTWVILTAAHVVTAVENRIRDCKVVFSNEWIEGKRYPAAVKDYSSIYFRVSNSRRGDVWNPAELDIGLIIPTPSIFEGLHNLRPIEIPIGAPITSRTTAETAIAFGFPARLQIKPRNEHVVVSNPVYVSYTQLPSQAREDDFAINWSSIWQVNIDKLEKAPDAGGMSGGPFFSYIREPIAGAWTPEKQLIFSGILHYQHEDAEKDEHCLLGHSRQVIKDFLYILLNGWGNSDFRAALDKGYKPLPI